MQIFLKNDIIKNQKLSVKSIAVYVGLMKIFRSQNTNFYVNPKLIIHALTNSISCDRIFINDIIEGLNGLIDSNIIKLNEKFSKSEFSLNLSNLYFKTSDSFFIIVDESEIFKIMDTTANKYRLLQYFLCQISTLGTKDYGNIHNKTSTYKDIGYMTQSYFTSELGMPVKTVYNYNKILQAKELIYIYRPETYQMNKNQIYVSSSIYGRFSDKEKIIKRGIELEKNFSTTSFKNKSSSEYRTLANKFRYVRDHGKIYSDEVMLEIYNAMVQRNKEIKEFGYSSSIYKQRKKDLSVFSEYDFFNRDVLSD